MKDSTATVLLLAQEKQLVPHEERITRSCAKGSMAPKPYTTTLQECVSCLYEDGLRSLPYVADASTDV